MCSKTSTNPAAVRSKEALARAFIALLQERDIADISVEDITRTAGRSRQTFYTNFNRKEDILAHVLEKLFAQLAQSLDCVDGAGAEALFPAYFGFWSAHRQSVSVLFRSRLSYLFAMRNVRLFQEELAPCARAAGGGPEEAPYLESYLSGLTFSVLRTWFQRENDLSVEALSALSLRLLRGGYFNGNYDGKKEAGR